MRLCRSPSHVARACPRRLEEDACWTCSSPSHVARDCVRSPGFVGVLAAFSPTALGTPRPGPAAGGGRGVTRVATVEYDVDVGRLRLVLGKRPRLDGE